MYIGAASGAVTVGLALFLVIMSQNPAPPKADQPDPQKPVAEKTQAAIPVPQAAVRLPPPPAAAAPAPSAAPSPVPAPPVADTGAPERPPLKPRAAEVSVKTAPLKPRPPIAANPVEPKTEPPAEKPPERIAKLPPERPATAPREQAFETPRESTIVSRETMTEGRALLKMLEAGKGPVIEIAWPASAADRARLYNLLSACHGMQTALLSGNSGIFSAAGTPGTPHQINRDAVSGFVRRPSGMLTAAEQSVIHRIKSHHGMRFGDPVRLFPRAVDATMLGGLGEIVGAGYLRHKTIRARYQLSGDRIAVVDVRADGERRPGGIVLPRSRRCR